MLNVFSNCKVVNTFVLFFKSKHSILKYDVWKVLGLIEARIAEALDIKKKKRL